MNEIHLKVFGLQTIEIRFLLVAFKINCRVFGIYANGACRTNSIIGGFWFSNRHILNICLERVARLVIYVEVMQPVKFCILTIN